MNLTNTDLQRRVDAVASAGGGVVEIPAGVYEMQDSLHLRSGLQILGDGNAVLRKVPSVQSTLANWIGYGHYEFTVTEPEKFKVGMGVCIGDKNAFAFYETVATITRREGRLFFIDRMLNHDCSPQNNGTVTSLFPLISGVGVRDVSVRGLVLDGNPLETRRLGGCRGGGVFLLQCHDVRLHNLEVKHYFGDAISFQQCTDVFVEDCFAHDNRGCGLHPGSGSVRYVMRKNRLARNTSCGVFYCLRTMWSRCEENVIEENGEAGISIGERDTNHAILNNVIRANHGAAIRFREPVVQGGDDVLIRGNQIEGEIVVPKALRGVCVDGGEPPSVGPEAAPLDAARHLNIEKLPPWKKSS